MELPSEIRFIDEKTKESFEKLKQGKHEDTELLQYLERAFEEITKNAFCGVQIPKRLIPKEYQQKHEIKNLWKYDLPNAWRLIYTIENQQIYIVSIILEWLNHKEYEKRFNY